MSKRDEMKPIFQTMTETTAVAVPTKKLVAKRKLTLDATSIVRLGEVICRVDGEWEEVTTNLGKCPAIPITDCMDNTSYLMLCNVQLVSGLERARDRSVDPPGTLVGKYFAIRAGEIVAGKRFRKVEVYELEVAR